MGAPDLHPVKNPPLGAGMTPPLGRFRPRLNQPAELVRLVPPPKPPRDLFAWAKLRGDRL